MEEKKQLTSKEVTAAPRPVQWLRGAIAVCILLLMGSILLNFHFWSKGAEARMEIKALENKYDSLLQVVGSPEGGQ
ncbi:MAG: hypothetical protein MUE71_10565 [Chitinophagaceae bacterium]|nr:hypothetical protein [Chitinophagaceae bacterium]